MLLLELHVSLMQLEIAVSYAAALDGMTSLLAHRAETILPNIQFSTLLFKHVRASPIDVRRS